MPILSIDTSTGHCSIAVTEGKAVLAELNLSASGSHSVHLMDAVKTVLQWARLDLEQLNALAVTRGPGSFTGLRIGISTVKGLAAAIDKPAFGISGLEALAVQAGASGGIIYTMVDARKKELYFAAYRANGEYPVNTGAPAVLSFKDVVDDISAPGVLIGSGALLYKDYFSHRLGKRAVFPPDVHHWIRASSLGWIAERRLTAAAPEQFPGPEPLYIRKPDAKVSNKGVIRVFGQ